MSANRLQTIYKPSTNYFFQLRYGARSNLQREHTKIRAHPAYLSLDSLYGRYKFRTQLPNFGQCGRCAYRWVGTPYSQNIHSFIPQKARTLRIGRQFWCALRLKGACA